MKRGKRLAGRPGFWAYGKPTRAFVVYSGTERYPKSEEVEAISVREMAQVLRAASDPGGQRKAD